jgi:hypothetical protein
LFRKAGRSFLYAWTRNPDNWMKKHVKRAGLRKNTPLNTLIFPVCQDAVIEETHYPLVRTVPDCFQPDLDLYSGAHFT